jgi:hypothetical protein
MLSPRIFVENDPVLASGTIVTFGYKPIRIYPFQPANNYQIELNFTNNGLMPSGSRIEIVDQNYVKLIFNTSPRQTEQPPRRR